MVSEHPSESQSVFDESENNMLSENISSFNSSIISKNSDKENSNITNKS
jgi:hypothetical protein